MATLPPVPQYLRWSEVPITWDRTDHPDLVPTENQYVMVINPLIDGVEFTKCMVDSGSSINIMYLDTLQKMNLTEANLRWTNTIFHGVVPGREARSLGCITLQVAFGDVNNYRQERMTFEVVPFKSVYHVIFGRDIFHTFMAKPCFVYNNLKILGPNGVIIVSGSFTKARDYEINEAAVAEAVLYSKEFKEIQSKVDDSEMPASKKQISNSAPAFKAAIETKPVELVVGDASKVTAIGTNLDPK